MRAQLPPGFDVGTHFTPRYPPWDQRVCFVRDGDLFAALRGGSARVATDTVREFTATGLRVASGEHLPADVVVTATGLELLLAGGMAMSVDGVPVDLSRAVSHKGAMLSGVPNPVLELGYTNASWALKVDLVNAFVVRLLRHLDARGFDAATPLPPPDGELSPLIDLAAGYVLRSVDTLPRQGSRTPWRLHQDVRRDRLLQRHRRMGDEGLVFTRRPAARPAADT